MRVRNALVWQNLPDNRAIFFPTSCRRQTGKAPTLGSCPPSVDATPPPDRRVFRCCDASPPYLLWSLLRSPLAYPLAHPPRSLGSLRISPIGQSQFPRLQLKNARHRHSRRAKDPAEWTGTSGRLLRPKERIPRAGQARRTRGDCPHQKSAAAAMTAPEGRYAVQLGVGGKLSVATPAPAGGVRRSPSAPPLPFSFLFSGLDTGLTGCAGIRPEHPN